MNEFDVLQLLKTDLLVSSAALDEYLLTLICTAQQLIRTEGITLRPECAADWTLVEMYAAYLYRKRAAQTAAEAQMPRMLRYALNNRLMAEMGRAT